MHSGKHTPFEGLPIHRDRDLRQETETGDRDRDRDRNRDKTDTPRAPSKAVRDVKSGQIIREVGNRKEACLALEETPSIEVFADGACEPNPGPGGWAFVVYRNGNKEHSASGADQDTTNNRMELTAALRALEWIGANSGASQACLRSDSQYVVKGCNEWRHRWKARGWRKNGHDIPNADLWKLLDAALSVRPVRLEWVRGHAGDAGNERADALASKALKAAAHAKDEPPASVMPVLMRPTDIIGMKAAEDLSGRDRRTVQRWCVDCGIGHQTVPNAPWEISAPALVMIRHGDFVALELLRCGAREHERVRRYLDFLGIA